MWLFDFFYLNFANLIRRGMDNSKYFRESLELRDNESLFNKFILLPVSVCKIAGLATKNIHPE